MTFIADFHTHSHFSRATSRDCTLEGLHYWAQLKGIRLVGCGDFTHPAWFAELRDKLIPSAPGLYRLRPELAAAIDAEVSDSCRAPVDFILSGEISSIYKRDEQVRKVHSLLLLPDLDSVALLNARLEGIGNIRSDGRPILGLDPRNLLQICLDICPQTLFIPAHIWTPWFSMLGSKSGFDSTRECFGELSDEIFAAETGLSSDPPMNWRVGFLDDLCLISNSDLHSPGKLGRNANIFHFEPDYFAIRAAWQNKDFSQFGGTIDIFPEEGKYHLDGHRKCGVCLEPEESLAHGNLCPVCGKPLVLGVLHRVVELADRPKGYRPTNAQHHEYIIPLDEILAEILQCGPGSKKVRTEYERLLAQFGPELAILRELPAAQLEAAGHPLLAEGLRRLRLGQVIRHGGFDGEYGRILLFEEGELTRLLGQGAFFSGSELSRAPVKKALKAAQPAGNEGTVTEEDVDEPVSAIPCVAEGDDNGLLAGLTEAQRSAAAAGPEPLLIVAGPGAGKTRTLTHRIAWLISEQGVAPEQILAVTFTNRAAGEMRERLSALLGAEAERLIVNTFHGFCLELLRRYAQIDTESGGLRLIEDDEEARLWQERTGCSSRDAKAAMASLAAARAALRPEEGPEGWRQHAARLQEQGLLPLDELVPRALQLLRDQPEFVTELDLRWICVDEYQDVNRAQYLLIRELAPDGHGLCVIGDPDQAIYGFRGADVGYFLRFAEDYPAARQVFLQDNFRSSAGIVAAAGQVMAPGRSPLSIKAVSRRPVGTPLVRYQASSVAAEAEFIAHQIEQLVGGTAHFSIDSGRVANDATGEIGFGDIAVLVRLRSQLGPLQEALQRLGVPVQSFSDQPWWERPAGKEIIEAVLQLFSSGNGQRPAVEVLDALKEQDELAALRELLTPGMTLAELWNTLLLRRECDRYRRQGEKVTLLTLHASKGLEFPVVFISGCEEGLIPLQRSGIDADPAEERRLFYVGMTRAQDRLYLTSAGRRSLFGKDESCQPSSFLADIEADLLTTAVSNRKPSSPKQTQMGFDF